MITKFFNWFFFRKKQDRDLTQKIESVRAGKKLSVALLSKPLQYMNLKAASHDGSLCRVLIICNAFANAERFVRFLQQSDHSWDAIYIVQSEMTAQASILKLRDVVELCISSDYGVAYNFFLQELHKRSCRIKLIEEGIGNYVDGSELHFKIFHPWLYKHRLFSKLTFEAVRNFFHWLSGSGPRLNLSKWVDEIHLYYPDYPAIRCRSREVIRKLELTPAENFSQLDRFFDFTEHKDAVELCNKKVLIYASNWDCCPEFSDDDLKKYDCIIVKYHPHIKDKENKKEGQLIHMSGSLPTEILIFKLLKQGCSITLRSKFTSSLVYLIGVSVKLEFEDEIPDFMQPLIRFVRGPHQ